MSEPPENEPDAPSSPGTESDADAPAEAAQEEGGKPATVDAAPSDDAKAADAAPSDDMKAADAAPSDDVKAADAAPADDAKEADAVASDDAKPPVSEAVAPPKKKAAKKKKKKSVKAAPPKGEAAEEKPAKKAKADKVEEEKPKPIPGVGTPDGDTLARAVQAFDAGNYALVRTLTTELQQATDADVKEYAKGLRRRIDVDPIQIVVLVACLALFLVIAYVYVLE